MWRFVSERLNELICENLDIRSAVAFEGVSSLLRLVSGSYGYSVSGIIRSPVTLFGDDDS